MTDFSDYFLLALQKLRESYEKFNYQSGINNWKLWISRFAGLPLNY